MRPRKCVMQLTVYLPEDLANALAMISDCYGVGESQVVRNILRAWLTQTGNLAPRHAPQVTNGNAQQPSR